MELRFWYETGDSTKLERTMGKELDSKRIPAWCHFVTDVYEIDYAIFSSTGVAKGYKIDVECDGVYHDSPKKRFSSDPKRDEVLGGKGWTVVRLKAENILNERSACVDRICKIIDKFGGMEERMRLEDIWRAARHVPLTVRPQKIAGELNLDF